MSQENTTNPWEVRHSIVLIRSQIYSDPASEEPVYIISGTQARTGQLHSLDVQRC